MRLSGLLLAFPLLLAASGQQAGARQGSAMVARPPFASLDEAGRFANVPGYVGAIFRDGRVVEAFAAGAADCDGTGRIDANAAFEIGSISKQVTAVALLKLWERGRVDLDAPVGRYLDDIPAAWRAVTLRQLLTHTSGVPDYEEAGGYGVYETSPTRQQVFAIVAGRPLDFEPGSRWSYSNTGYFLLGLVVERVSGMHFGDYLRQRVFAPLGMTHSFMSGYAPRGVTITQGCRPDGDHHVRVRPISEASTYGAGGILSTLADWALWDDALRDGRLLSARAMTQMRTPQRLTGGESSGYGFGLFLDRFRGVDRIDHSGQSQGFTAEYESYPSRGTAVLVLSNSYGGGVEALASALALRAMPDLSYDAIAAPADPDPQRTANARRAVRQYVLGETPQDLLDANLTAAAADPARAARRARLRGAASVERLVYLRTLSEPGAAIDQRLYRAGTGQAGSYFVVGWGADGKVHGLRWFAE